MKPSPLLASTFIISMQMLGCGQAASVAASHSSAATAAIFQTTGQTFHLSTGCSPHSTEIELKIGTSSIEVRFSEMTGPFIDYVVDLAPAHTITLRQSLSRGGPNVPPSVAVLDAGNDVYRAALHKLQDGVKQVRLGNACFAAKPQLQDVEDFLSGL